MEGDKEPQRKFAFTDVAESEMGRERELFTVSSTDAQNITVLK